MRSDKMIIAKATKKLTKDKMKLEAVAIKLHLVKIEWVANRCSTLQEYVDLAFTPSRFFPIPWINIRPAQVKDEIYKLLKILAKRDLKYILEIGTAKGGTLFLFSRVSNPNAVIISIDLPGGPFGGGYPKYRTILYKSFAARNQRIILIRKNSHSIFTFKAVKNILAGQKLDFLFIDGDHTYEGVKRDFEIYSRLVNNDGIIAFHDIVPGPATSVGGVPQFWSEIKHNFRYIEIVKDWKQQMCGIGVIFKNYN